MSDRKAEPTPDEQYPYPWRRREVIGLATLYLGDALSVLRSLPDGAADLLLTDPPYSSGGMMRGDRTLDVHTKYVRYDSESGHQLNGFTGDNRDQLGYWFWVSLWLSECRRVTTPGGIGALFCDWRQLPVTTNALQAGGYVWRGIVPWHKPNARPQQGRWANACEYLVWGTNGPRAFNGSPFPGMYSATAPPGAQREHITQKPLRLMLDLVKIAPPKGTVLDPFMGSGTTGVAAVTLGLRFIGVELDPQHFETALRRIADAQQQGDLFRDAMA
jgi:site-specific DNA-methyltransferase (adenine-specific)